MLKVDQGCYRVTCYVQTVPSSPLRAYEIELKEKKGIQRHDNGIHWAWCTVCWWKPCCFDSDVGLTPTAALLVVDSCGQTKLSSHCQGQSSVFATPNTTIRREKQSKFQQDEASKKKKQKKKKTKEKNLKVKPTGQLTRIKSPWPYNQHGSCITRCNWKLLSFVIAIDSILR